MKTALIFLILLFSLASPAQAQDENLSLVIVPFTTIDELNTIFSEKAQVLYYSTDDDNLITLAILTPSTLNSLRLKGFNPEIIAANANLEEYVLLYSHSPNQASLLAPFGKVSALSTHLVLFKQASANEALNPVLGNFQIIPFFKSLSPPPLKTKTASAPTTSTSKLFSKKPILSNFFLILAAVTILLPITFIITRRFINNQNTKK